MNIKEHIELLGLNKEEIKEIIISLENREIIKNLEIPVIRETKWFSTFFYNSVFHTTKGDPTKIIKRLEKLNHD